MLFAHFKIMFLELWRQPAYVVPTLLFPALFFLFFAQEEAKTVQIANIIMGSFAAFAVFGVVFFQFGVGIANDRSSPWAEYLRTLPVAAHTVFAARLLTALVFALLAALVVIVACNATTPVELSSRAWAEFAFVLTFGSAPFLFLGIALGYWVSPKSALPLANMIYLPLSFAGGLWKPPQLLPPAIAKVSAYLPSRHYGEVVWTSINRGDSPLKSWLWLLAYALIFASLAFWGYQRQQIQRYR
ncbi:MAG TPA: ABC transporter permease [Bdellovibrionales bacterium]|nr:ABC transporter permease [Bdellovibrionales bacterium]